MSIVKLKDLLLEARTVGLYHVFSWDDPNMGWGQGKTLAIVKAVDEVDARKKTKTFGSGVAMGYGVDRVSPAEANKIKANITKQIKHLQKTLKNIKI